VDAEGTGATSATPDEEEAFANAATLLRRYPHWAIWLPASGRAWTAVRPASSRPPAPELPMMWVNAGTASELDRLMQAVDEQVSASGPGHGWPDQESG